MSDALTVGGYEYTFVEMNVLELPPNEELLGPEPDRELLQSIDTIGIIYPLVATLYRKKFHLIDGRRRIKAARELGIETLTCMLFQGVSPVDRAVWSIVLNEKRSINSVTEYLYYKRLMEEDNWEEITKLNGLNKSHFKKVMSLENLKHPEFVEAFQEGTVAESTLFDIAKLGKKRQDYLLEVLNDKGKVAASDVKQAKTARANAVLASKPEMPNMPEAIEIDNRPIFMVLDSIDGLPREYHEALQSKLESGGKLYRLVEV